MAQRTRGDELYTTREHVELILDKYLKNYDFEGKTIYCPCDSDWSNFVKVLKERKDTLKYKELIYTSDDFRNHKDIFKKADLVLTNPPFSLSAEFTRHCALSKDAFFMSSMWSIGSICLNGMVPYYIGAALGGDRKIEYCFMTPEGKCEGIPIIYSISKGLSGIVPYVKQDLNSEPSFEQPTEYTYYGGMKIPKFKKFSQIPNDIKGIFAVPDCCLFLHRQHNFDIIELLRHGTIMKIKGTEAVIPKTNRLF